MKFLQKLSRKNADLYGSEAVTIAFLGDSVTHGCFELRLVSDTAFDTVYERENAYSARLVRMLSKLFPARADQSGKRGHQRRQCANGAKRLARDILPHHPDLTVVCYGLNDCMAGPEKEKRAAYVSALREIFTKLKERQRSHLHDANMMCEYVDPNILHAHCVRRQRASLRSPKRADWKAIWRMRKGRLLNAARRCATVLHAGKIVRAAGVDTTALLSNQHAI